jgi:hypothetical protein
MSCVEKDGTHTYNPDVHVAVVRYSNAKKSWHPEPRVRDFRKNSDGIQFKEIILQDSYTYDTDQKSLRLYISTSELLGRHHITSGDVDEFYSQSGPIPFAMLTDFHHDVIDSWSAPVYMTDHINVIDITELTVDGDISGSFDLMMARDTTSPQYDSILNQLDTFRVTGEFTAFSWE